MRQNPLAHVLRDDPEWKQMTVTLALHGPTMKERHMNKMQSATSYGLELMLRNQNLNYTLMLIYVAYQ